MEKGRIFICETDEESRRQMRVLLESGGYLSEEFGAGGALLKYLADHREESPDLILLDTGVPGIGGFEIVRRLREVRPEIPLVMVSAFATVRAAVEAMKLGASDFLLKPILTEELLALVEKIVERNRLMAENRSLKAEIRRRFDPDQVIFRSSAFRRVFDFARKVASADACVLIQGESGTGKELIASTIHYASPRRDERFLTINCAALTETLLESQLFGYQKGAFTGAVSNHRGLVEEAHKGTLFLDEIGDITPALQAKLLRVLQEKEFIPVGATRARRSDVRFLAATNKDLEKEVAAGRFREDLYYRLNVISLHLPALRERKEDIAPLAEFFLAKYSPRREQAITPEALSLLQRYDWPGNVRELENVIEMAVILSDGLNLSPDHLPVKVAEKKEQTTFSPPERPMSMADVERLHIEQIYRQTGYHKVRTAEILQVSRKTLSRKLQSFGIDKSG